jgi:hypothetical protein
VGPAAQSAGRAGQYARKPAGRSGPRARSGREGEEIWADWGYLGFFLSLSFSILLFYLFTKFIHKKESQISKTSNKYKCIPA